MLIGTTGAHPVIHLGHLELPQSPEAVRWQALVATAVGVAVGKWLPGIVPLNAVLGAAFIYFILVRLTQRPVLVQEASKC